MKKTILNTIIGLSTTAILFTGCGIAKNEAIGIYTGNKKVSEFCTVKLKKPDSLCKRKDGFILVHGNSNLSNYGMTHLLLNNSTAAVLQAAAETTILNRNDYFAILDPKPISNEDGSLINTAKEFMNKCGVTMGKVATFRTDECGLRAGGSGSTMAIKQYANQPGNIVTYNAWDVIQYLKDNKLYDKEASVEKVHSLLYDN